MHLNDTGFLLFDTTPEVSRWAGTAHEVTERIAQDAQMRAANLRHGETWFVGVDALPNGPDGAVEGVQLTGPWEGHVTPPARWHAAQLSIVYPGYPQQDPDESDANHRFRIHRHAAHVDGLLPEGSARRRFLREPHAFILGLPLNACDAAPLMVWPGSHRIMGAALRAAIGAAKPDTVDLTDAYQTARRAVFDTIPPEAVHAAPGQSVLLHRHLLHGVAPWDARAAGTANHRAIAYFRPQGEMSDWL